MTGAAIEKQFRFWIDISYRMLRIRTVLMMITFEAIGYEVTRPTGSISLDFVLYATMLGTLYMSATCFNDVADEEVDKINLAQDKSRPLMTTNATPAQLRKLGIITIMVSVIAALLIRPSFLLLTLAGVVLSVLYSLPPVQFSHRGILASLWLPLSYVALPFIGGVLVNGSLTSHSLLVLPALYVSFIGRILLKDYRDYEGDKKVGKRNFLVRHGPLRTAQAAAVAWVAGDALFVIAFAKQFPFLCAIAQPIIAIVLALLYALGKEKKRQPMLRQVSSIGRLGNAVLLALLADATLQAYTYTAIQNNLIIATVTVFMAGTIWSFWQTRTT